MELLFGASVVNGEVGKQAKDFIQYQNNRQSESGSLGESNP
jgi:hypothetical protein